MLALHGPRPACRQRLAAASAAGLARAPGWRGCRGRWRRAAGFTLLELLVVISIIAIGSAGVAFSIRDSAQTSLDREGERLAALLEAGRALSRTSGQTVRWHETAQGFGFDGLNADRLPQGWLNARTSVDWGRNADRVLVLGPEPIIEAQSVVLVQQGRQLLVATDGLRPFAVSAIAAGQPLP